MVYIMVCPPPKFRNFKDYKTLLPDLLPELKNLAYYSVLINLHWLTPEQRILFKLLLNTSMALHGLAPDYLENLLTL